MRGEGNHKIPGSFAPENMEKTGAERVKYSLACQYEDAISIKFVSYAQKCPTVLCTFAVALRKESVDRNPQGLPKFQNPAQSLSARRAWIEIALPFIQPLICKSLSARRAWIEIRPKSCTATMAWGRSPQGERGMFLFLTVQGGFVHADIRFNFKNCYSKKLSHKII